MKNCRFPIDILWLDEEQRIVHVAEAVPPCKAEPCPVYNPLRRASYVIELNAGQARREKAVAGGDGQLRAALALTAAAPRPPSSRRFSPEEPGHQHPEDVEADHRAGECGLGHDVGRRA